LHGKSFSFKFQFVLCLCRSWRKDGTHQGQSVSISDFKISSSDGLKFAKKLIKQQSYILEQHVIRTHRCTVVFKFVWGPGYLGLWENLGDRLFLCYTFIVFLWPNILKSFEGVHEVQQSPSPLTFSVCYRSIKLLFCNQIK